ncbi:hypothetical protein TIFTF001_012297 [Ficus carica]|uniref:Uncharacterized protein n=1 Tax=Ficus carica TaxID=3494 RepID=A0AA88A242_FICCA|nr:hypothetical protein TIFTF001_012297 [Ficus carica]
MQNYVVSSYGELLSDQLSYSKSVARLQTSHFTPSFNARLQTSYPTPSFSARLQSN